MQVKSEGACRSEGLCRGEFDIGALNLKNRKMRSENDKVNDRGN